MRGGGGGAGFALRLGIILTLFVTGIAATPPAPTPTEDLRRVLGQMKQLSAELAVTPASTVPSKETVHYHFEPAGQVGEFGSLRFKFHSPAGICADAQYLYIADKGNGRIVKMNHEFRYWDEFRIQNEADYPLDSPSNLALIGAYVVVADSQNNRIVQFRDDGTYVGQFGKLGITAGFFDTPMALAQNSRREWVVVDSLNHRIQTFTDQNKYITELGATGGESETLKRPTDLVILRDDSVVVADSGAASIKIYNGEGRWISGFMGRFKSISGITIDDQGMLYIADTKGGKVFVYTVTGRWVGQIDTPGPVDVACWGDWVFVTDQVHHCIRKFRRLKG